MQVMIRIVQIPSFGCARPANVAAELPIRTRTTSKIQHAARLARFLLRCQIAAKGWNGCRDRALINCVDDQAGGGVPPA
jgi:hypothetical protein